MLKKFFDSWYWVLPLGVGSSSIWFIIELVLLFTKKRSTLYFIEASAALIIFVGAMLLYDHLESKKPPD
jgi:ABC-type nickel/cobalt efflux system permease component RcnA